MQKCKSLLTEFDANVDCKLGVWPTIKCDFRLESSTFVDEQSVNSNLLEKIEAIQFEESHSNASALNSSLSCFDLNNQTVLQTEDKMFYGKVNATCILNYQRAEQSIN